MPLKAGDTLQIPHGAGLPYSGRYGIVKRGWPASVDIVLRGGKEIRLTTAVLERAIARAKGDALAVK